MMMTAKEYKAKINARKATNYEAMRAMSDEAFAPYEVWNAAKAIKWTIKTGRISALKERKFEELSGCKTVDLVFKVARLSNEVTLAAASKAFLAVMK
jgi:hypothetical protein